MTFFSMQDLLLRTKTYILNLWDYGHICSESLRCEIDVLEIYDRFGYPPLHHAIIHWDRELIENLLHLWPLLNLDFRDAFGETALHHCVKEKNYSLMSHLIQLGANVNLKNVNGHTLLHIILLGEKILDYGLLSFLVRSGALVKLPDSCDQTPLSIASERNDSEAFRILLTGCVVSAVVLK